MAASISQTKVTQFANGLTQALNKIDANVSAQVWAESLPVIGDNLKAAADGGTAQLHYAQRLGAAIANGLGNLTGATSYTAEQVQTAVNTALAAAGFSGAGVTADFSLAGDLKLNFATIKSDGAVNVAVEKDFGLPNLGLETSGTATASFGANFKFQAGIDSSGFYVAATPDAVLNTRIDTKLPGLNTSAELGGLGLTMTDDGGSPSAVTGEFAIALKDPGANDGKIRVAELGGDLIDATMDGVVNLNLDLKTVLPANVAMPQLATELKILQTFTDAIINPLDDNSDFGNAPSVWFNNTSLNLGTFFDGLAGQVLNEVSRVTAPLKPIIDILTTPIPVLSDLGSSKVTLLDFAGLTPDQTAAIKGLADIIALADEIDKFADASTVSIDLGSMLIDGDLRSEKAIDLALGWSAILRRSPRRTATSRPSSIWPRRSAAVD